MKTILYTQKGYNEKRNILGLTDFKYQQSIDLFKLICHFYYKIRRSVLYWALNLYWNPIPKNKQTILHLFNGICLSHQRWITTFETALPRLGLQNNFLNRLCVKRMAHGNCKRIIAMSKCNYEIQRNWLNLNFKEYANDILSKTTVLHPPQKLLVESFSDKKVDFNKVKFVLIGADFFRKGGLECLKAFKELKNKGYDNWEFTIISTFQYGDYASKATDVELLSAKEIIKDISNIRHYSSLPNNKVLSILKSSHIGLLPTYADTYGYSVLEAQACGCPVISTDIRALPEINNNKCGWIINIPKDGNGNAILNNDEHIKKISIKLENELTGIIESILKQPISIKEKSTFAIERIRQMHEPNEYSKALVNVYTENIAAR